MGAGEKIRKMQEALKREDIDAALIMNTEIKDPNMRYFTSLDLDYSFLVIPKQGNPIFLVSSLEYERAKKWSEIKKIHRYKKPWEEIQKQIKRGKIGINEKYISIAAGKVIKKKLKKCAYKPLQNICEQVRVIKTKDEIDALKIAAKKADDIFTELIKELKENRKQYKTEKDIALFIERKAMQIAGGVSFEPIVASGKNAAFPHYVPQDVPLQRGFCVLDFGVKWKNYVSDISRTIFFGKPTKEELRVYERVKNLQEETIACLKIGKQCKEIDRISRKRFQYPHSLGHGIGVEVHEAPSVSPKNKEKIKENMCFTIEPGLYVPEKYGIRIEDDIWMTKEGPILLTKGSKELFVF